jgi:hypothetical protein
MTNKHATIHPSSLSIHPFPPLLHIRQTLIPEIGIVQLGIVAVLSQQPIVISLFDDGAFLHDDDPVRRLHSGQAMRDQDAGRIFQDQVQRLLDLPFLLERPGIIHLPA